MKQINKAKVRQKKFDDNKIAFWKTTNLFTYSAPSNCKVTSSGLRKAKVARALLRLTQMSKIYGVNIEEPLREYLYHFEETVMNKGILYTCKLFKSIYGYIQRYSVSHKSDPIPYLKLDKYQIPLVINKLRPLIRGDIMERRMALTVLQVYKLVDSFNDEIDYSSITAPSNVVAPDYQPAFYVGEYFDQCLNKFPEDYNKIIEIKEAFKETIERMFPLSLENKRFEDLSKLSGIHISGKSGPNGPSLTHTALDFYYIYNEDRELYDNIKEISQITCNTKLNRILQSYESNGVEIIDEGEELCHSRLSLKQEVGGKNRVFAIADNLTQSALSGMHKYCFRWLENQPEDGTFDHNRVAQITKEWTNDIDSILLPHSVDLSKATDRAPSLFQAEIVTAMFGKRFGKLWYKTMTNRKFRRIGDKSNENNVQYSVGQPMGVLSSWAMLAIWHHVILRTILAYKRIRRFKDEECLPNYTIIGDDVAMRGPNIYKSYMYVMSKLCDVPVSELKGFTPDTYVPDLNPLKSVKYLENKQNISVEIAKRVFIDGHEVTPISPVAIQMGFELPCDFPSLLFEIDRRGYDTGDRSDTAIALSKLNFNPTSALSLASFPLHPAPQLRGLRVSGEEISLIGRSPWLGPNWSDSHYDEMIKIVLNSLRTRLNTGISEVYQTLMPYMSFGAGYNEIEMKRGWCILSSGLDIHMNEVYRECNDLITNWAVARNDKQAKEFWTGTNPDPIEFKRYLGKMHVIFDITTALGDNAKIMDEKRFSSKFLQEIVKDFLSSHSTTDFFT